MTPDLELEQEARVSKKTVYEYEPPLEPGQTKTTEKTTTTKHSHLRANVKRRRGLYALIIFLALVAIAVAIVDILVLRGDKDPATLASSDRTIEYAVYGILALLFIWAIILFLSRRSGDEQTTVETTTETVEEMRARLELERSLMQCPDCKSVFQFGEAHFRDNKRTAFSCPVCGVYSRLPDPAMEPVKVLRPEGEFKELQYHCTNCDEDLAVGTFGETPLHLVRFRACPSCGERGFIERIGSVPPMGVGPAPDDGGFTAA
ncbi:MAG: hypothetical protein V4510_01570 [bacterium]